MSPKQEHKDASSGKEHVSRAKDPAIVAESQKPIQWISNILRWVGMAILLILAIAWLKSCGEDNKPQTTTQAPAEAAARAATSVASLPPVEALVLAGECLMPCTLNIAWKFKVRVDDRIPFRIIYKGAGPVDYPAGDKDFKAPAQMRSGETGFESLDSSHPNARVRVYRKILVSNPGR